MSETALHTWAWGSGETTLVFLHALLPDATGRSIEPVASRLVTRLPLRVVGIDGPGFGASAPWPDEAYDLDRLARRIGDTAIEESGGRLVAAGHSWGAALAVRIAAAHPDVVRGLVLLDGGHFDHADLPDADPAQTVEQTQAEMAGLGWAESSASPRAAAAAMTALMRGRSSPSYPAIAASGMPVLLLTATEPEQRRRDNEHRTRQVAAAWPRLTAQALPGLGHDLVQEGPDRVADEIVRWWGAEIEPSTPALA